MSIVGEAFVRIRPQLSSFAAETTAGVKTALTDVQTQVNAAAKANVASDMQVIEANRALALSYREIGAAAAKGSEEAAVATRLAAESTAAANAMIGETAAMASRQTLGLKHHLLGLAEIVGIAFGAKIAVDFVKDIVNSAASVQKSEEVIAAGFGKASEAVIRFGETGATALGISRQAAAATSARFAILFANLGIGPKLGSQMTVNLEKLAGALSAIRGVDPSRALQSLTLAMLGNVRSLKHLGISVYPVQMKLEALKLGLISTTKDALTPAAKAQAIYAIATHNLGKFMDLARKHSGDLATVQFRLAAAWENAKDSLGTALMPIFLRYTRSLANWLQTMERSGRLQRDFNGIARTAGSIMHGVASAVSSVRAAFQRLAPLVGGTANVVKGLMLIWAVGKIMAIAGAFKSQLAPAVRLVRTSFIQAKGESVGAFATIRAGAIATGITIKAALVSTGIGLLIVAIGIAAAYVMTHWEKIKIVTMALAQAMVAIWQGLKTTLIGIAEIIGGSMATALVAPLIATAKVADKAFSWIPKIGGKLSSAANAVEDFATAMGPGLVSKGLGNVSDGVSQMAHDSQKAWAQGMKKGVNEPSNKKTLLDIGKDAGSLFGDGMAQGAQSAAKKAVKSVADATKQAIAAAHRHITSSILSAEKNLDSLGNKLASTIAKIADKIGVAGKLIANSPQAQAFKKLKELIASGAPSFEISRASTALSSSLGGVGKSTVDMQKEKIKAQIAEITRAFNTGKINLATFDRRIGHLLSENHLTFKAISQAFGKDFARQFQANVRAIHQQAKAIAEVPSKYRREANAKGGEGGLFRIVHPLEVIRQENAKVASVAQRQRDRIAKATEKTATNTAALKTSPSNKPKLPGHAARHAGKAALGSAAP